MFGALEPLQPHRLLLPAAAHDALAPRPGGVRLDVAKVNHTVLAAVNVCPPHLVGRGREVVVDGIRAVQGQRQTAPPAQDALRDPVRGAQEADGEVDEEVLEQGGAGVGEADGEGVDAAGVVEAAGGRVEDGHARGEAPCCARVTTVQGVEVSQDGRAPVGKDVDEDFGLLFLFSFFCLLASSSSFLLFLLGLVVVVVAIATTTATAAIDKGPDHGHGGRNLARKRPRAAAAPQPRREVVDEAADQQDGRAGEEGLVGGRVLCEVGGAGAHPAGEEDQLGRRPVIACGGGVVGLEGRGGAGGRPVEVDELGQLLEAWEGVGGGGGACCHAVCVVVCWAALRVACSSVCLWLFVSR